MEDYKSTIEIIEHYKTKACEVAGKECDKCEQLIESLKNNPFFKL